MYEEAPNESFSHWAMWVRDKKYCRGPCGEIKDRSEFYPSKRNKDGLQSQCKKCYYKRSKKYKQTDKGKEVNRKSKLKHNYNISAEEYTQLWLYQDKKCYLCDEDIPLWAKNTHVDHCHDTNKLRGISCDGCNKICLSDRVLNRLKACGIPIDLYIPWQPAQELWPGRVIDKEWKDGQSSK